MLRPKLCCAEVRSCGGWAEIGIVRATYFGGSEALEEREQRVGSSVAAGFGVGGGGAVEGAPFEFHVGVQVLVGGIERLMPEP